MTCHASATDAGNVQIGERPNATGQIQLEWQSQTGKAYRIYQSTALDSVFTTQTQSMEATPPNNTWWIDKGTHSKRFFKVEAYTEAEPTVVALNTNSDFSGGINDWITTVNASAADATFDTSNGDLFVDITNGGTNTSHIFLRQFNIPLVQNQSYTLLFDARATAERDIRVTLRDGNDAPNFLAGDVTISNVNAMQTYRMTFTMTGTSTSNGRLTFLLGNDNNKLYFDNIRIINGTGAVLRSAAHRMNTRLYRGNNFMASKAMNSQGAPEDYTLLNTSGFNHCRIGYKMDEVAGASPNYTLPQSDLDELQNMVDWCLQEGLIAVVDPVHNWANTSDLTFKFSGSDADFNKLGKIWEQVAALFANYDLDKVVFEVFNEPHNGHDVARIISTALSAIRVSAGNEARIVIVPGDGFSTRQALIDAFNNDEIPSDDLYLIGTFHYYDPFSFTKMINTNPGYSPYWGSETEFAQVATDFDAVETANNNWANRNHTEPLPVYLGEFGVDNEADSFSTDRKKWLSWIRMQAEKRGFSWAHWNMYQNQNSSKGMGPWVYSEQIVNPEQRSFDAEPLEALVGHYEFENGTTGGGVSIANDEPGYKGTGYASFPASTGTAVWARAESIYIPKDDTYAVKIHYASASDRLMRLVSRNDTLGTVQTIDSQLFPATGGNDSWSTLTVNVLFEAGEEADLKLVATPNEGVNLDWIRICLP
jgi:endoglucanase